MALINIIASTVLGSGLRVRPGSGIDAETRPGTASGAKGGPEDIKP